MAVRQRGNVWQADVRVGANANPTGKEVRLRLSAPTQNLALGLEARARLAIMETGSFSAASMVKAKGKKTLKEALKLAWSSRAGRNGGWGMQRSGKGQHARAAVCVGLLGEDRACSSITTSDLHFLVDHFRGLSNSNDTIRLKVQSFYKMLEYAVLEGWMPQRPRWVRPAPGQPRNFIYTPELEEKLVSYFRHVRQDEEFADLVVVAVETGIRQQELLKTRVSHYHLVGEQPEARLTPDITKTASSRDVILSDRAREILVRLTAGRPPSDFVFRAMSHKKVSERMRMAREALGYSHVTDFNFHALRHTRATRLARLTGNVLVVKRQLGHQKIETSMRYIHMTAADQNVAAWRNWATASAAAAALDAAKPGTPAGV